MGIHNYEAEYARAQEQVTESQLSLKNKQLIFSFVNDLLLEGLSLPRLIKYLRLLRLIGVRINKDFDTVSKDDLKQFISSIQQKITYSPWTIRGYKEIIRKYIYRLLCFRSDEPCIPISEKRGLKRLGLHALSLRLFIMKSHKIQLQQR